MEVNAYKLTVTFEGGENGNGETATPTQKEEQKTQNSLKRVGSIVKAQVIRPFIQTAETIYFNNLETSTGSRQLVERQRLLFDGVQKGISAYQSAMGGVAFATAIGLSSGIGAGIGIGLFALQELLSLVQKQSELNKQERIENTNISYQRTRMGIAYNKSRTGA